MILITGYVPEEVLVVENFLISTQKPFKKRYSSIGAKFCLKRDKSGAILFSNYSIAGNGATK